MTFIDTEIYVLCIFKLCELRKFISEREVINIHFRHMSRILTEKATLLIN